MADPSEWIITIGKEFVLKATVDFAQCIMPTLMKAD